MGAKEVGGELTSTPAPALAARSLLSSISLLLSTSWYLLRKLRMHISTPGQVNNSGTGGNGHEIPGRGMFGGPWGWRLPGFNTL